MKFIAAALSLVALAFAAPAAADPPAADTFEETFPDVNPCTGNAMNVTIVVNLSVHDHGDRVVSRGERTITTSDGFAGRGTETLLNNGQNFIFRQTDIMTNDAGDRFRAHTVVVVDLATDTARVETFELTCLKG